MTIAQAITQSWNKREEAYKAEKNPNWTNPPLEYILNFQYRKYCEICGYMEVTPKTFVVWLRQHVDSF